MQAARGGPWPQPVAKGVISSQTAAACLLLSHRSDPALLFPQPCPREAQGEAQQTAVSSSGLAAAASSGSCHPEAFAQAPAVLLLHRHCTLAQLRG